MAGLRRPAILADFPSLKSGLVVDEVDLLMISISARGFAAAGHTVTAIRNGRLGNDPFLPVMVVTDSPSREDAALLVNSGVDCVAVRPLTVGKICERLRKLALSRQPFVVTSDYIGPDRRTAPREPKPGEVVIPLMQVPNALYDRIVNNQPSVARAASRAAAWDEVMRQRLVRCADSMQLLAKRSLPQAMAGDLNLRVLEDMRRIADVSEIAWKRMEDEGQAPLAKHLGDVTQRMRCLVKEPTAVKKESLAQLQHDIGVSQTGLSAFLAGAAAEPQRV
jgi:hypothetical protein